MSAFQTVQVILKDEHCCNFIHMLPPFPPAKTCVFKVLFGGIAGLPLVPQDNRKSLSFRYVRREPCDIPALAAFLPIHVKWFAYNDFPDFVLLSDLPKVLQVPLPAGPPERRASLSGDLQGIANRNADIPVSHV